VQRDQAIAIGEMEEGKEVVLRARIHHIRNISRFCADPSACAECRAGAKVAFIIFRQQMDTIQGVFVAGDALSENMIKWACRLDLETVVLVRGIVQAPKAGQEEIKSTSVHNREILVKQVCCCACSPWGPKSCADARPGHRDHEDGVPSRRRQGPAGRAG
jgi:hypothetical protein